MRHSVETNTKGTSIYTAIDDAKGGLGETTITIGGTKFTPAEFDAIVACVTEHKALIKLLEPKSHDVLKVQASSLKNIPVLDPLTQDFLFNITSNSGELETWTGVCAKLAHINKVSGVNLYRLPTAAEFYKAIPALLMDDPESDKKIYWTTDGAVEIKSLSYEVSVISNRACASYFFITDHK